MTYVLWVAVVVILGVIAVAAHFVARAQARRGIPVKATENVTSETNWQLWGFSKKITKQSAVSFGDADETDADSGSG